LRAGGRRALNFFTINNQKSVINNLFRPCTSVSRFLLLSRLVSLPFAGYQRVQ
jgi:hypothetical protein